MPVNLGGKAVPITCQSCGHEFAEELRRFEAHDVVECPECHQRVRIELANPGEVGGQIKDAIERLKKSLKGG